MSIPAQIKTTTVHLLTFSMLGALDIMLEVI